MTALRVAFRQHVRHSGFAITVVCILALTIGAATAVFSVVTAVLVRALPFSSPERLVWVASVRSDNSEAPFSLPEFMDYRTQVRSLSGLAAYANWSASLAGDGQTERLQGARMSGNAFEVLGVAPSAGRLLNDADDRSDAPRVVVVSHRLWQRQYGGAADLVGRAVRINSESYVVVGVLPAHFPLPLRDIDLVTPLTPDRDPLRHVRNSVNFLRVFGRLAPGRDPRQAEAELTGICRLLREQFPVEYARKEAVRVDALHNVLIADFRQSLLTLFAAVVIVLATALANLASLALVRASRRRSELAVRIALGASLMQLARQLAVEAMLLAGAGGVLGWMIAAFAGRLATLWAPASIPRLDEARLDGVVALFVAAVAVAVTALLTAAPLASFALAGRGGLRPSGRGAIGDRWNRRLRSGMVVSEIAAALVLLLATAVLVQNLRRLQGVDPGFDPVGVFQARVSVSPAYRTPDDVARFYDRLSAQIVALPGVAGMGVISVAPLTGLLTTVPFSVAGASTAERDQTSANIRAVSPGYLPTVGTRLLQGRPFAESDRSDTPAVAIVSASLADRFLSGRALGRALLIDDNNTGPRAIEVVGVIENVRHTRLDRPAELDIYVPLRQVHPDGVALLRNNQFWMVKIGSDPAGFGATFGARLREVDPDAAVSGAGPMQQFIDASLGPRRFNLALFGVFALTAVLLAVVGLYGLVSYAVRQRAAEIGLRMAIGATGREVQWMILRQAAGLGLSGAAIGLAVAAVVGPLVSRFAPGVTQGDEATVDLSWAAGTAALLIGVVLLAAWLPARRAARVLPTTALKEY